MSGLPVSVCAGALSDFSQSSDAQIQNVHRETYAYFSFSELIQFKGLARN